jgi:outer membrane protein TolC/AcrR family transcriptional regulator
MATLKNVKDVGGNEIICTFEQLFHLFKYSNDSQRRIQTRFNQCAGQVFAKFGYKKTTLDDIALLLGKGKTSFYYYFEGKDGLYKAVLEAEANRVLQTIEMAVTQGTTATEKLSAYVTMRFQSKLNSNLLCEAFNHETIKNMELVKPIINQFHQQNVQQIKEILEYGVAENEFSLEEIKLAAFTLETVLNGLEPHLFEYRQSEHLTQRLHQLLKLLFNGIKKIKQTPKTTAMNNLFSCRKTVMTLQILLISGTLLTQETYAQTISSDTLTLTFDEALFRMENGNQLIKASQEEIREKELEKKATRGLYLPKFEITGAYTILNDDVSIDLKGVKSALGENMNAFFGSIPPQAIASLPQPWPTIMSQMPARISQSLANLPNEYILQEQQFALASASAMWPIYAGGKIRVANQAAQVKVEESRKRADEQYAVLITELATRYFGLALANEVIVVRREVLAGMESHAKKAESLSRNGIIANAERLHAEVYRAEAYRAWQGSVRDAAVLNKALAGTLAVELPTRPASPLFYVIDLPSIDYFKSGALQNNPRLKQVALKKQLSELNLRAEKAAWLPSLAITGNKELYTKDLNEHVPDWFVGIGLKYTLFDGMARTHKIQAARSLSNRIETLENKAETDIAIQVENLYSQLMKISEQLISIDASLNFSNEYLIVREKSFNEGLATSLDVVDARLNLAKVKIERLQLIYQYDVLLAQLLEVCGLSNQFETFRNLPSTQHQIKGVANNQ